MSNGIDTKLTQAERATRIVSWVRDIGFFSVAAYLIYFMTGSLNGKLDTIIGILNTMAHK